MVGRVLKPLLTHPSMFKQNRNLQDEDEHDEEADDDDDEIDVEKIEQEPSDEPISTELPALPEEDEDDDQNDGQSLYYIHVSLLVII